MAIHNDQRKTALVVDDSLVNRALLNYWLNQEGFEVTQVPTLGDARLFLAQAAPDIAIVDIHLPDGSGLQLPQQYVGKNATHWVATSLPADDMQWSQMQQAGFALFLPKPFDHQQLLHVLQTSARKPDPDTLSGAGGAQRIPVLDFGNALRHLGGDIELMRELVGSFLEDWSNLPGLLAQGIEQMDYPGLARHAHTAAGLAGQFGLCVLMQRLQLLELAARDERPDPLILGYLRAMATHAFAEGIPLLRAALSLPRGNPG